MDLGVVRQIALVMTFLLNCLLLKKILLDYP